MFLRSSTLKIVRSIFYVAVTLLLSAQFQLAIASNSQCRKTDGYDPKLCECGANLTSYPLLGIENFPLVEVCGYRKMDWGVFGQFTFLGRVELTGKIRREDLTSLGDAMSFSSSEASRKSLPHYLWEIRFNDAARKSFSAPEPSDKVSCWEADSTIVLRKLGVQEGPGTDNDGSFAVSYTVKNVGRFKQCVQ